jgi:flagellin
MVINTNVQAQVSASNLNASQSMLSKSLARLSSGSKIVSPSDDAAGLAVSTRLDAQAQRLSAAKGNVGNAISFTQTQDGYLKKIGKAQDVTKSDDDRSLYNAEFQQIISYVNSAASKDFNGVSLFSSNALSVTIDSEGGTSGSFTMNGINLGTAVYTSAASTAVSTTTAAVTALTAVKNAISQIASDRATIGAYQQRLNFTSEQLTVSRENLLAASSRIQDIDVAEESTQYARYNILVQSGTAMLAQANQLPQTVLRLLQ